MDNKLLRLAKQGNVSLDKEHLPNHVAISAAGHGAWAEKHRKLSKHELFLKIFEKTTMLISCQCELDIPVMTIRLLDRSKHEPEVLDALEDYLRTLRELKVIHDNHVKISILGKWYTLPSRIIDSVKALIDDTKDYDAFFLNICLNYDGKEEIVDAARLVARKVEMGKMDGDAIGESDIKENIYSSYFLPPALLISTGVTPKLRGFLLWDSTNTHIHFTGKPWLEFLEKDFVKAIKAYQDMK